MGLDVKQTKEAIDYLSKNMFTLKQIGNMFADANKNKNIIQVVYNDQTLNFDIDSKGHDEMQRLIKKVIKRHNEDILELKTHLDFQTC